MESLLIQQLLETPMARFSSLILLAGLLGFSIPQLMACAEEDSEEKADEGEGEALEDEVVEEPGLSMASSRTLAQEIAADQGKELDVLALQSNKTRLPPIEYMPSLLCTQRSPQSLFLARLSPQLAWNNL